MSHDYSTKCWICGCSPNSDNPITLEHRVKSSDLKDFFGPWSLDAPLYFHTPERKNIPIGGNRSKRLKLRAPICQYCNSTRTQPYDDAWKALSQYLQENVALVTNAKWIDVSRVFPGKTKKSMLDVHLFFVKLFGCLIVEEEIPIDIAPFSNALINRSQHDQVYLAFGPSSDESKHKRVLVSPVNSVDASDGSTVFAHWVYMLGKVAVTLAYSKSPRFMRVVPNAWQPDHINKIVRLSHFKRQPQLRAQLLGTP